MGALEDEAFPGPAVGGGARGARGLTPGPGGLGRVPALAPEGARGTVEGGELREAVAAARASCCCFATAACLRAPGMDAWSQALSRVHLLLRGGRNCCKAEVRMKLGKVAHALYGGGEDRAQALTQRLVTQRPPPPYLSLASPTCLNTCTSSTRPGTPFISASPSSSPQMLEDQMRSEGGGKRRVRGGGESGEAIQVARASGSDRQPRS